MHVARLMTLVLCAGLAAGCGDNATVNFPKADCSAATTASCVEITGGDSAALQAAANSIEADATIVLGAGRFTMTNQLTFGTARAHLIGQGIDVTTLDFGKTTAQLDAGVYAISDGFLVQDLTVLDAPKNGIKVEHSNGVVFRRIRATWTKLSSPDNGAYGIYPVTSQNVLVEDSRAENAADAGLYVGQCQHVIVHGNTVTGNVAGLEIENTQYADVYGNTAEDNTGGIVVFDLPGNPIVGRDVRLRDNMIRNNNHVNFAAGGTVASIPVGTGTFAMASRRVEITGNTYEGNNTGDIALISGLAIEQDFSKWTLPTASLAGTYLDLDLVPGGAPDSIMNFRSENIVVANNKHSGSGTKPDTADPLMLGLLFAISYGTQPVDSVLYDAIGEPFLPDGPVEMNVNHMCVGGNTGGTFAMLWLNMQSATTRFPFYRPAAPFKPFDCTVLAGDPIADVTLP
jgi:parallel beta-helix repeat protein